MTNYILKDYSKEKIVLSKNTVENLKSKRPSGCPFENYSLFNLLLDLFNMYAWTIQKKNTGILEFLESLKKYDIKAALYYDAFKKCLEA